MSQNDHSSKKSSELPSGWAFAEILQVCDIKVQQGSLGDLPIPYIDIGSIDRQNKTIGELDTITRENAPSRAKQWVQKGDVLVSMTRPNLNAVALVPESLDGAIASTGFDVLRPIGVSAKWIFNRVRTREFILDICKGLQGVVYPAIRPQDIRRHVLPIPPLSEQDRIVSTIDENFSRLDEAAMLLERVQRNLKRYRASVLKAAVEGRLVPTEAELARAEGRDYEPASVLLNRILAERRRRCEESRPGIRKQPIEPNESQLPDLPEGWCWASWFQIGNSQNGRSFPSSQYRDTGVRLLRPGNLHISGTVQWTDSNTRYMDEDWAKEFPSHIVGQNELVMNLTAQSLKDEFLGRICMTAFGERCLLNQRIARLTPYSVNPRYVFWIFKSPIFRRFVNSLNTGSLIEHMFTSQLNAFFLPLPPLGEQKRIVSEVERLMAIADFVENEARNNCTRASHLRQSILKWAFEGKLADQDPADEPASVLLERIRAEREDMAVKTKPKALRRKA